MMRMRVGSATLTAFLLLAVGGCGGGGGGEAPPPAKPVATTTTPAPAAAGTPTTLADEEDEESPLLAWADATPEEGKAPLTVEFKADVEGGTPPLKYTWKFNDGSPDSSEPNPKHTFEKPGKYRADLEVTDSAGDEDADYIDVEAQ